MTCSVANYANARERAEFCRHEGGNTDQPILSWSFSILERPRRQSENPAIHGKWRRAFRSCGVAVDRKVFRRFSARKLSGFSPFWPNRRGLENQKVAEDTINSTRGNTYIGPSANENCLTVANELCRLGRSGDGARLWTSLGWIDTSSRCQNYQVSSMAARRSPKPQTWVRFLHLVPKQFWTLYNA